MERPPPLPRRVRVTRAFALVGLASFASAACASDFSTARDLPPSGTLGTELYIAICDRVAAQALPEDVTGASWHPVCHPDTNGQYAATVDTSQLVALDPNAVYADGGAVAPLAVQQADRAVNVARIEAIARDRAEIVTAFDTALPDVMIPLKNLDAPDPTQSCVANGSGSLHTELANVLGRMTPLEDDATLPLFTEALGRVMTSVQASPGAEAALANFDAREGYRPLDIVLGAARPLLAYPALVPTVQTLLTLLATDSAPYSPAGIIDPTKPLGPGNRTPIPGADAALMQQLLEVGRDEWRTPSSAMLPSLLKVTPDPLIPSRQLLSRPWTTLELTRQILLQSSTSFEVGLSPSIYVTARDPRGYAAVPLVGGAVPAPFVDDDHDGLPDVDGSGVFLTTTGEPVASPFFSPEGVDGPRNSAGQALGAKNATLYQSLDVGQTFLAALENDLVPLLDPSPVDGHETVMNALAGAYVLFGGRSANATKTYPADPESPTPTAPVVLKYDGFDPTNSPLEDLVYALAVMMADPVMDDLTQLGRELLAQHPQTVARLVGLGLQMKAFADAHPEAHIPAKSTLWDELLDDLALIAHQQDNIGAGGVLEDLLLSFGNGLTPQLQPAFAAYTNFCDQLSYDPNSTDCSTYTNVTKCALNGPPYDSSSKSLDGLHLACSRNSPDVGTNRSALQMFMQTLHDARGMSACTKQGAVANVTFSLGSLGTVTFDYPTNSLSKVACTLIGAPSPPNPMPECGILSIPDVDALLLDVVLNRATFDIQDPCLLALMKSPVTNLVGGVDAFLQQQSGVVGFDTHPTVPGVSRFFYFATPDDGSQGDVNPATKQTWTFIQGLLDPAPTSACKPAPITFKGTPLNLFDCSATPQYDLRHRDPGATFPLELYGFTTNVQPLAASFDDHGQSALFVDLFNTLHLHWGSTAQPKDVCDPSLPRSNDLWCSQDGAVSYEPLLYEDLTKTDLLETLHDTIPILQNLQVTHCSAQNPTTHACTKTTKLDGIQVISSALRVLIDPAANKGLTDRHGVQTAPRNDGTTNPQVTPIYLFLDALDGIDAAFASWATAHPMDDRHPAWLSARSQLVDEFFSVNGSGANASWVNPAVPAILPPLLDAVESQILAQCPDRSSRAACAYFPKAMPSNMAEVLSGPTFASMIDLVDALRQNAPARTQVETLLQYLLGSSAGGNARGATMAASVDVLQELNDDPNLQPLYGAVADVLGAEKTVAGPQGQETTRGLADGALEMLSRVFAKATGTTGQEICSEEIDPNEAIASVLGTLVAPSSATLAAPIDALMDVAADVNRANPAVTTKLAAADYANIAAEVADFCLDPTTGLEQVYAVVREATMPGGTYSE